jgi:hypothetical protein
MRSWGGTSLSRSCWWLVAEGIYVDDFDLCCGCCCCCCCYWCIRGYLARARGGYWFFPRRWRAEEGVEGPLTRRSLLHFFGRRCAVGRRPLSHFRDSGGGEGKSNDVTSSDCSCGLIVGACDAGYGEHGPNAGISVPPQTSASESADRRYRLRICRLCSTGNRAPCRRRMVAAEPKRAWQASQTI